MLSAGTARSECDIEEVHHHPSLGGVADGPCICDVLVPSCRLFNKDAYSLGVTSLGLRLVHVSVSRMVDFAKIKANGWVLDGEVRAVLEVNLLSF